MIRRLDLGRLSPLRTQAVYHGLAEAMDRQSPDTVVFCAPDRPYVCVGHHQQAPEVLDLAVCSAAGWPVLRRRVGGGAVYLDESQLFYQVVVHRSRAPASVERIYAAYLAAPVLALRRAGVDAELRAPNEIEARGRRIAGTGGGQLGEAMVVVGNVLFDFPVRLMARAWRVPSSAFRRLARQGLARHVTTLRRELGRACPPMDVVQDGLAAAYAETLGEPLVPGTLTERERDAIGAAEAELAQASLVPDGVSRRAPGLKIARGVHVYEGRGEGPAVTVRVRDGIIDAVEVAGADRRTARRFLGSELGSLPFFPADNPAEGLSTFLAAPGRWSPPDALGVER